MWDYLKGHVIDKLRELPPESIQMVVTSPPYWGLRKYDGDQDVIWGGAAGCEHDWAALPKVHHGGKGGEEKSKCLAGRNLAGRDSVREYQPGSFCQVCGAWRGSYGLEPSIELYVEHTVEVLREIRRVLKPDGVVFWNIGDSYAGSGGTGTSLDNISRNPNNTPGFKSVRPHPAATGLKPKDLCLIPFRVALAVQADGWWVRSDIIWSKPNPMPESCKDRPTRSHEYIFLFTKSQDYYWDADAVKEPHQASSFTRMKYGLHQKHPGGVGVGIPPIQAEKMGDLKDRFLPEGGRNMRTMWNIPDELMNIFWTWYSQQPEEFKTIWTMTTHSYKWPDQVEHFATFPEELPRKAIKAGSRKGDTILDPFAGSGTTLRVARDLERNAIGIDISDKYKAVGEKRADLNTKDILGF